MEMNKLKSVIEGNENFIIKNATVILPPWNNRRFIQLNTNDKAVIENCFFKQESWREWFLSLFRRK